MKYSVGYFQFKPELFEYEKNLLKMKKFLSSVTADLIVLPELATSGYIFNSKKELESVAEDPHNGPTAQLFRELATQNNTSYVVGFAEKNNAKIYNSSMLVNPDEEIFVYRKTHLFFEEKKWFTPGNSGFKVFSAKKGIKVGLMICFDWIFPESARSLALQGAQIIAHPANLVLPWCQQAMITRSLENRVFTITANRIGKEINLERDFEFTGMSQITDVKGNILSRADKIEEKVNTVDIDPSKALDKNITEFNHAFKDRRTKWYHL